MRRVLVIFLSLVMGLVGLSTACADDGFYVVAGQRANYAPVPKSGQTTPYATGDDGTLRKGVASPTPRFTDNGNGTVTDNLTGLVWMKNASNVGAVGFGLKTWADALTAANSLKSGDAGLSDGSKEGDWRLPNVRELQSLIDYGHLDPAIPAVHPFTGVQSWYYWSSTTYVDGTLNAWDVGFNDGGVFRNSKTSSYYVWCVRGGP
jgi:hypothetical protein